MWPTENCSSNKMISPCTKFDEVGFEFIIFLANSSQLSDYWVLASSNEFVGIVWSIAPKVIKARKLDSMESWVKEVLWLNLKITEHLRRVNSRKTSVKMTKILCILLKFNRKDSTKNLKQINFIFMSSFIIKIIKRNNFKNLDQTHIICTYFLCINTLKLY